MRIEIAKWGTFQHFTDRDPIWIKLYRELRNKREWRTLPPPEAKCLIDLWMLASEQPTPGVIDLDIEALAWELRAKESDVQKLAQAIAAHGFITLISDGYQADTPRALAREEKRREETDTSFEELWSLCRRGSKPKALAEYRKAVPAKVDHAGMMASRMAHVTSASAPKYVAHLERWIRDERWQEVAGNGHRPVSGALARPRL